MVIIIDIVTLSMVIISPSAERGPVCISECTVTPYIFSYYTTLGSQILKVDFSYPGNKGEIQDGAQDGRQYHIIQYIWC